MSARKRSTTKTPPPVLEGVDASLLDIVDHVLTKGIVLTGDLVLGVADVDPVYLRLSAVLCAADRILARPEGSAKRRARHAGPSGPAGRPALMASKIRRASPHGPRDVPTSPVCEVTSMSTSKLDRAWKLPLDAREGVPHAWLVDPLARTLEGLRLECGHWLIVGTFRDDERVRAEPFDAIELDLAILWADVQL